MTAWRRRGAARRRAGGAAATLLVVAASLAATPGPAAARADDSGMRAFDALTAVLRGRVTVRGAALGPGQVTASRPDGAERLVTDTDTDGRYELRVRPGRWRVTAESRYGLPTRWPDLPMGREDAPDVVAQDGEVRDGLDFSLRARLAGPGTDEYGTRYAGHDPSQEDAAATSYPRDPYRSVLSPNGPRLSITVAPHHDAGSVRNLRPGELLTFGIGGVTVPVTLGVRNTGDDTVFLRDARFDGGDAVRFGSCTLDQGACGTSRLLPGQGTTMRLWPVFAAYRFHYATTFVVPGGGLRIPLVLRNVAPPGWGTDGDARMPADWAEHAPLDQVALAKASGRGFAPSARAAAGAAPAPSPTTGVATPAAPSGSGSSRLGTPALSRTALTARFPVAGRATVRIDRQVAPAARTGRPARWRTVGRVTLRARRPGVQRARVRRIVPGRYRMRVQSWLGGAPLDARTVTVRVSR
ncbi:hypothetical protein SK069_08305 [Patulibacter brassicae]|jgi:hypothetical protein|uniref:Carboxypeptidase regulatory-like domain-containing protein n=1 Tax=Patulibacter brassicae TaxID=1705717 RepID=A0ABU4VIR9_9ACTN|nr:hypothetical protein [Patulibacter brassicae]MDX8151589.1 hypothetical protein [Patulibacter brassicae]